MGTLKIVSADPDKALSLKVEALKNCPPAQAGRYFLRRQSPQSHRKLQQSLRRISASSISLAEPEFDIDDATKTINLTLRFSEEKQYYVRRIDFTGNTTTRDKVIRRELLLDEGQLFNKRAWEISILRLNQLNYFERIEEDKAAKSNATQKKAPSILTLKLKEKGKQSIGLQGGVSGLAGTFIGLTYQTNNFLGLGETLTFSAQFGDLQSSFMFGFTRALSLRQTDLHRDSRSSPAEYNFDQAQQEAQQTGQCVSINPEFRPGLQPEQPGFHGFRQLSASPVFVCPRFDQLRAHAHQHHGFQRHFPAVVYFAAIPQRCGAERAGWHCLQHHHALDHLKHHQQSAKSDQGQSVFLLRGIFRRTAGWQRKFHFQYVRFQDVSSHLSKAQRDRSAFRHRVYYRLRRQRRSSI